MGSLLIERDFKSVVQTNESPVYLFSKRALDIVSSFCGLIILSPLLLLIALLIKLEDPKGSVFFLQERCGQDGKAFKMIKYRTMCWNAEEILNDLLDKNEMTGPVFKIKNDPRITKIGKILRKTSVDELPQLINILKGEMSLVGPRPPLPREVEKYTPYQMQRLMVKPGLTCIWQVSGRNSINFEEWVELDLKYIRERNFWFDLLLILKTIPVLLGDENAA